MPVLPRAARPVAAAGSEAVGQWAASSPGQRPQPGHHSGPRVLKAFPAASPALPLEGNEHTDTCQCEWNDF